MAYEIFGLSKSKELAEKIANKMGMVTSELNTEVFSDGEIAPSFPNSLRGKHVYIVGSTNPPADNFMELLLAIDSAKRAGAYKVHAVVPYFGYARQDKKGELRSPIGASVKAQCIQKMNTDSIICTDLHASQIEGFFTNATPVIQIQGKDIFAPTLQKMVNPEDWLICTPDAGGSVRAKKMKNQLGLGMVVMDKTRDKPNSIGEMQLIGDVTNKKVIIVDDMIDTGGTLCKGAQTLLEKGASEVYACITHGVLSGKAYENIRDSKLKKLFISDSIPIKKVNDLGIKIPEKIEVISCSDTLAKVIKATRDNSSINKTINSIYEFSQHS